MKKWLKMVSLGLIISSLSLNFGIGASAAEVKKDELTSSQRQIVEIIKSTKDLSKRNNLLAQAYKKGVSNSINNETKKVVVDNTTTILFDKDNTFVVKTLEPGKEITTNLKASQSTTKNYTNTVSRYGPINNVLYTISVTGYFTGIKGQVPTGHLVKASYTRGTASMWNVDNWEKGADQDGSSAYVYGRGNFHYGVEIKGQGFHIQDVYEDVNISCNSDWHIFVSD